MEINDFIILIVVLVNFLFYFNLNKISNYINIFDKPDKKRKIHKYNVPSIGGIIFILNILIYLFFELTFQFINTQTETIFLIFTILTIFILGFCDDKFDINSNFKLISFILIISIYFYLNNEQIVTELKFSSFSKIIHLGTYSFIFSVLSIVIFMNAFNMYDGINGQSGFYTLLLFSFLLINGQNFLLGLIIIICSLFFLYFNLKSKIFLGDNGSLVISFLFSVMIIKFYNSSNNFVCEEIFILMMLPGIDMTRLFIERMIRKKNPLKADKNHLHHLLLKSFNSTKVFLISSFLILVPILLMILKINYLLIITLFLISYSLIILRSKNYI